MAERSEKWSRRCLNLEAMPFGSRVDLELCSRQHRRGVNARPCHSRIARARRARRARLQLHRGQLQFIGAAELHHANRFLRPRGPDATTVRSLGDWSFLHNLLSMTGAVTTQPFVSADGGAPRSSTARSTTSARWRGSSRARPTRTPPTASRCCRRTSWGVSFVQHLEGEFALVVVDLDRRRAIVSADVFGTKPLWFAIWQPPQAPAPPRILVATYESALLALGAPRASIRAAPPNEALVLRSASHSRARACRSCAGICASTRTTQTTGRPPFARRCACARAASSTGSLSG